MDILSDDELMSVILFLLASEEDRRKILETLKREVNDENRNSRADITDAGSASSGRREF